MPSKGDDFGFQLNFSQCRSSYDIEDSPALQKWVVRIYVEDENDTDLLVGILIIKKVCLWYKDKMYDPLETAHDGMMSLTHAAVSQVWDEATNEFHDFLGVDASLGSILVPTVMVLLPEYRGKGLAEKALKESIEILGGNESLVVIEAGHLVPEASPLRCIDEETQKQFSKFLEVDQPIEKLIKHYKNMGFRRIKRSCFLYHATCGYWANEVK